MNNEEQETKNLTDLLSYLFTLKITENERTLLVEKIDKLIDVYINRIKELQSDFKEVDKIVKYIYEKFGDYIKKGETKNE